MTNSAIAVRDLVVHRSGREVLRGLTFDVAGGMVTGLLGPSGGGKTTLMRCIVGVQIVRSGEVLVLGEPAGGAGLRRRVGYKTQSAAVYGDLTVRENLQYFAAVLGIDGGSVATAIHDVDLDDHADYRFDRLSGGQQVRVSLAAALLGRPELLVLDEPTVGLDPVLRRDLWALFHRIAEAGTTLVVSSHVMDEAERCDRLLLLRDGTLVGEGTSAELLERTGTSDMDSAFLRLVEERAA
jgi:ABC-2 type transport system ATP-binding protein